MAIYILFPILLIVSGVFLCRENSSKLYKIIYTALFGAALFGLAALRYMVGTDYYAYSELFNSMRLMDAGDLSALTFEKGFAVLLHILAEGSESFVGMFALIALIVAAGVAVYIYRYSSNACISALSFVMLGCFFYSMNFMRQFVAAVILMYAIRYVQDKSFIRYLILVLFAAVFHWSALLLIPFYFILKIRLEPLILAAYALISVMFFVFSDEVVELGISIFYTKYENGYTPDVNAGVPVFYVVGYGLLLVLAFVFRNELYKRDQANSIYINCLFFAVMFELLGFKHAMLSRFALLFIVPSCIVLVPELVAVTSEKVTAGFSDSVKKTFASMTVLVVFAVCGSVFYGFLLAGNSNGVVPYRTVYEYNIGG